jgi:hypothetical protein
MLRVSGDLRLLAPLCRLLRRLSFCVCDVRLVPLLELWVDRVVGIVVDVGVGLWWWLRRRMRRATVVAKNGAAAALLWWRGEDGATAVVKREDSAAAVVEMRG